MSEQSEFCGNCTRIWLRISTVRCPNYCVASAGVNLFGRWFLFFIDSKFHEVLFDTLYRLHFELMIFFKFSFLLMLKFLEISFELMMPRIQNKYLKAQRCCCNCKVDNWQEFSKKSIDHTKRKDESFKFICSKLFGTTHLMFNVCLNKRIDQWASSSIYKFNGLE